MSRVFAVSGAVAYLVWGVLHLLAAANAFRFADGVEEGLVQGRLHQGAFYVAVFALVAIIVAVRWNWRNSRFGYWANLFAVSTADIPFVLFIVLPGHMTGLEALLGPSLWITGLVTSTLAQVTAKQD